jgi:hypothetical protein
MLEADQICGIFHCWLPIGPCFWWHQVCPWMVGMCKSTSSFASSDQKGDFSLETPRSCPRGNWMKLELPVPRQFRSLASTACQVARWTGFGTHTQLYWALYQARSRLGSQLVLVWPGVAFLGRFWPLKVVFARSQKTSLRQKLKLSSQTWTTQC